MSTKTTATGEDVIMHLGNRLFKSFSLADPVRRIMYEKAYYNFAGDTPLYPFDAKLRQLPCKELNIDPRKGLLLIGDVGVGKSILFKIMAQLFFQTKSQLMMVTSKELAGYVMDESMGEQWVLDTYGPVLCDLYIDDVGHERVEQNLWGNVTNIIEDLICLRADLFVRTGFKTHLSTNIATSYDETSLKANEASLKKLYKDRAYSRILQMNNILVWKGADLRKKEVTNAF